MKKIIKSNEKANVKDQEGNEIELDNFEYQTSSNIFKSIGYVKIIDNKKILMNFHRFILTQKKRKF